jgi:hypothetical protein
MPSELMVDDRGLGRTAAGAGTRSVLKIWVTEDKNANPREKKDGDGDSPGSARDADQTLCAENSALRAWPSLKKTHDSPPGCLAMA